MKRWQMEKKAHQYIDATRLATRISIPLKIYRMENTHYKRVKNISKEKGKGRKKRSNSGEGEMDIHMWISMLGRCLLCLLSNMQYSQYRISKYCTLSNIDMRKYRV